MIHFFVSEFLKHCSVILAVRFECYADGCFYSSRFLAGLIKHQNKFNENTNGILLISVCGCNFPVFRPLRIVCTEISYFHECS